MDQKEKKRLTLEFDPNAYDLLEELAHQSGKTKAGVVRTALALYAMAQEEEKKHNNKLAIVDESGKQLKQILIT